MKQFLLSTLLLSSIELIGQNPFFAQHFSCGNYYNPAFTGSQGEYFVHLNHRNQWPESNGLGIKTSSIGTQIKLPKLFSLGLLYLNDLFGASNYFGTNTYQLMIAKGLPVKGGLLKVGTGLGFNDQYQIINVWLDNTGSSSFSPSVGSFYSFTGNLGIGFHSNKLTLGIAARNLKFFEEGVTFLKSDLTLQGSYKILLSDESALGFGTLIQYDFSEIYALISSGLKFKWLLLNIAYRLQSGPTAGAGVQIKKVQLKYSFDYFTQLPANLGSRYPDQFRTAHEVSLSWKWNTKDALTITTPLF